MPRSSCLIINLSRKHGGKGWMTYDRLFCQQMAAGSGASWAELNPSLMAATVLVVDSGTVKSCSFCLGTDHAREDCALAPLNSFKGKHPSRPKPYRTDVCRRFNRGSCPDGAECRFEHSCLHCSKHGHGQQSCPLAKGKPKPAPESGK